MFDKHKSNRQPPAREDMPPAAQEPPSASPLSPPPAKSAVIGAGIVIKGDIGGSDNLLVDGKVGGSINLPANEVSIGRSGQVHANVMAKIIRIAGQVQGDLHGKEKVIISSTGQVNGNVIAPRVILEDGAIFKGSIDMNPGERASAEAAAAVQAAAPARSASPPELVAGPPRKAPDLTLKSG